MREAKRYLGLELAGAKNQKTAVAALEFYPKERKIFLLDLFDRVIPREGGEQNNDEALLELLSELGPGVARLGVNVPLSLPPCIGCTRRACVTSGHCAEPAAKWMREAARRASRSARGKTALKARDITPYTQRPVELYVRYQILPRLPESHRFEIDEPLGGNKAPLAARMHYLQRFLAKIGIESVVEAWPKLTVAVLALELGLSRRIVTTYRHLEQGAYAREEILETLAERHGIFIYERDVRKLSQNLACFDAFFCAYTALLSDLGLCAKATGGFPAQSGWVQFPQFDPSRGHPGEASR